MTALKEFERLEASGLWRASKDAQRRDVIVSLGDASLIMTDMSDRPLSHWSLSAVARANPGQRPARYHPEGDTEEELELGEDAQDMIAAIERLRREIARRRPGQGRLRGGLSLGAIFLFGGLGVFWLPDALVSHAVRVVPEVNRAAIGLNLLEELAQVTGPPCRDEAATPALRRLSRRVLGAERAGDLIVLRRASRDTAHLPGGLVLLNRSVLETHEDPEAAAGYVLAENLRAKLADPLAGLLRHAGMLASAQLLTTGELPGSAIENYAAALLVAPVDPVDPLPDAALLAAFHAARLSARPYAYARDASGETTIGLIEADPWPGAEAGPIMSDNDWLRLQTICGT